MNSEYTILESWRGANLAYALAKVIGKYLMNVYSVVKELYATRKVASEGLSIVFHLLPDLEGTFSTLFEKYFKKITIFFIFQTRRTELSIFTYKN